MLSSAAIISAFVSLLGAVVSVTSTVYASQLSARTKSAEVQLQVRREITIQLIERRIECYPELFCCISTFIKQLDFGQDPLASIQILFDTINNLDSQYALFFSSETARKCSEFRKILSSDIKLSEESQSYQLDLQALRDHAVALEVALRSDLGIYGVTFPSANNVILAIRRWQPTSKSTIEVEGGQPTLDW
jgi:hypothetical protein